MYINSAYLGKKHEIIVNTDAPLIITAVGHYRVYTKERIKTYRKDGRADYQLLYIADGKLQLLVNGKQQAAQKGNMILFRPGEPQMYEFYAKDKPEIYWVHFTGNNVNRILEYYNIKSVTNVFFTGISGNYGWVFNQMIQELQLKRTNFPDMLSLYLRQLLLWINRNHEEEIKISASSVSDIEKALQYFNKNYYLPIEIEKYASEHGMTPCYFIRIFKKFVKTSPMQYIVSLRINSAINQLDNTDSSISKIAESVGYEDAHYFSRLFRRHVGMSPSAYRKKDKK